MRVLIRVVVAFAIILLLIGTLLYSQWRPQQLRVSGFIESHEIRIGSRVGGRVAEVLVDEGQSVRKGDLLVRLEPFDLQQRRAEAAAVLRQKTEKLARLQSGFRMEEVAQASAQMAQRQARLRELKAGPRKEEIDAARARLELARAEFEQAQLSYDRIVPLLKSEAATQDQYDEAEKQLKVSRARLKVAEYELKLLEEGTRQEQIDAAQASLEEATAAYDLLQNGYRKEEIAEAAAAVDAARATLQAIEQQLEELSIVSPVDGVVESCDLRPGDLISANAPAMTLTDPSDLWVRAYVPENQMNLKIGEELRVTVDSFPGKSFRGRITYLARRAEFTPRNVQTPEERSKQVFRIKVEMIDGRTVLRPGMSADVWLPSSGD